MGGCGAKNKKKLLMTIPENSATTHRGEKITDYVQSDNKDTPDVCERHKIEFTNVKLLD